MARAIDGALAAKVEWEAMPWNDRAAIFLKAADLVSGKYRYKLMAATILGQGKNVWQAEIDAAAEVREICQFFLAGTCAKHPNARSVIVGGFLQIRSQVRGRAVLATAFEELGGNVEVSLRHDALTGCR